MASEPTRCYRGCGRPAAELVNVPIGGDPFQCRARKLCRVCADRFEKTHQALRGKTGTAPYPWRRAPLTRKDRI